MKKIGSVLSINAGILPVFEQLGLSKELQKIAIPVKRMNVLYDNLENIATVATDARNDQYVNITRNLVLLF